MFPTTKIKNTHNNNKIPEKLDSIELKTIGLRNPKCGPPCEGTIESKSSSWPKSNTSIINTMKNFKPKS